MRKDYNLEKRKYVIGGFITVLVMIYIVRLFALQVGDVKYKESADSNAFLKRILYPARGLVYDRNDKLVVFNKPATPSCSATLSASRATNSSRNGRR